MFAENSDCKGFLYGLDIAVKLHEADIGSVVVRLWWLVVVANQFCIRRDAEERWSGGNVQMCGSCGFV